MRYEAVLSGAWQIVNVAPATVFEHSGSAAHHVRVDIYGEVKVDGEECTIVRQGDILAVVED